MKDMMRKWIITGLPSGEQIGFFESEEGANMWMKRYVLPLCEKERWPQDEIKVVWIHTPRGFKNDYGNVQAED